MKARWAFDLGTNSIGWAVFRLTEDDSPKLAGLVRLGSRIFSDGRNPKDGSSLAEQRRLPRQARRRRDRQLYRKARLIEALITTGLWPVEKVKALQHVDLNPYELRARAVNEKLSVFEIGRAFFHLNQRRGFKSNRKANKSDDSGKIKSAVKALRESLNGQTIGEALYARQQQGLGVRARLIGTGAKSNYDFYIDRDMMLDEFERIWAKQTEFHPQVLNEDKKIDIRNILFAQRPLRPVEPGKCFFDPNEKRLAAAHVQAQQFKLVQEINHLRIITLADKKERALTKKERDSLVARLEKIAEMKFPGMRKELFGSNANNFKFTLETEKRKGINGNLTNSLLSKTEAFGTNWFEKTPDDQQAIVQLIIDEEDEIALATALANRWGLAIQNAEWVATRISLPDDFLRLGPSATNKILAALIGGWDPERDSPLTYDKAVRVAGYQHHAHVADGEIMPSLPYYGQVLARYTADAPTATNPDEKRYGKIGNPTVHIVLNQLRKLVNALLAKYGHPSEIHIEVARELKIGRERLKEIESKQKENQDINDRAKEELLKLGQRITTENILRWKLYEELGPLERTCVYSGQRIELPKLFSNEYQIDHILPFSRTLDDGQGNKILVHHSANRFKTNKTPFEAFGHSPSGYDWIAIVDRAKNLRSPRKHRLFEEKALENWLRDESDFLARQLTDTAYIARVSRQYLQAICPANRVITNPGRVTALVRQKWGLNDANTGLKNREDHRHHAIDACVIASIDRATLQGISTAAKRVEESGAGRLVDRLDPPFEGFQGSVMQAIQRMVVSYKPDHSPEGALHNDTAYGIAEFDEKKQQYTVYSATPTETLSFKDLAKLREFPERIELLRSTMESGDEKTVTERLLKLIAERKLPKKVRIYEAMKAPIRIRRRGAAPEESAYKAYKGDSNYCYELYINEKGKWDGDVITTFAANQAPYRKFRQRPDGKIRQTFHQTTFSGKPLLMRLMRDDMVAIHNGPERAIFRLARFSEGVLSFAGHSEANVDARFRDKENSFKYLFKSPGALPQIAARKVLVDILGFVKDPRPLST